MPFVWYKVRVNEPYGGLASGRVKVDRLLTLWPWALWNMGTRCSGERRRLHGHTHAGPKLGHIAYFYIPGPPQAKLKEGLGLSQGVALPFTLLMRFRLAVLIILTDL